MAFLGPPSDGFDEFGRDVGPVVPGGFDPAFDGGAIGPTQSPVLDAMTSLEERDRIEADYEWFRYSKFALPFLFVLLLITVALFCLTLWQGNITLKHIGSGIPRQFEIPIRADDNEGGIPKYNRNTRIASFLIGILALAIIAITMYTRPAPKIRKSLYLLGGGLLLIAGIVAAVAFGLDAGNVNDAVRCRAREQGTVVVFPPAPSAPCQDFTKLATANNVAEGLVMVFAIITAAVLIFAALKSAKEPDPDVPFEDQWEGLPQRRGVSKTTRQVLLLLLFATFVSFILMIVFTVLLHETRDVFYESEVFMVRHYDSPLPGWPIKNTRLRLALTAIVILAILINFIPFRSRVIAYSLAFIYFASSALAIFAFALDVKEVDTARDRPCPTQFDCEYDPYIATTFLDILLGIFLILYVLFEFIFRLANEARFR